MEDFSTSSDFSFVENLMPRMYAVNPAYKTMDSKETESSTFHDKTNKAKLMRDERILRTFLDGKREKTVSWWKTDSLCYSKRYGAIEYFDLQK